MLKRLPVIGITGSIGSGKSMVAQFFAEWGARVISGDQIGREILGGSPSVQRRLIRAFGDGIAPGGRIDRGRLALKAFATPQSLLVLNQIIHPPLIRELNRRVAHARRSKRHRAVVIDAALLAEWGIGRIHWDHLVGVWAPVAVRQKRLKAKWTAAEFHARARRQMPWSRRKKLVDCVVKNDSGLRALKVRARLCWIKLLS